MSRCPTCGGPISTPKATTAETLRRWCQDNGRAVLPDDSVYEETAAAILDRAPQTLANRRAAGGGIPFYRSGRTGRVRYRIEDLAAALDECPIDTD